MDKTFRDTGDQVVFIVHGDCMDDAAYLKKKLKTVIVSNASLPTISAPLLGPIQALAPLRFSTWEKDALMDMKRENRRHNDMRFSFSMLCIFLLQGFLRYKIWLVCGLSGPPCDLQSILIALDFTQQ